jgi:HSP20 family protein
MNTTLYHPMNRLVNELNVRLNNMPRYAAEARRFANVYAPKVHIEFAKPTSVVLTPRVDVLETPSEFTIVLELAGVAKENVSITVQERVLTIKGEKKRADVAEDVKFLAQGRRFGAFERSFELSENVDTERINAEFANGVLTLTIAKTEPKQPITTTIEIK